MFASVEFKPPIHPKPNSSDKTPLGTFEASTEHEILYELGKKVKLFFMKPPY